MIVFLSVAHGGLAYGYYFLGDLENARKQAELAVKIDSEAGITVGLSKVHRILGMLGLDSGDLKTARGHLEQALNLALTKGEKMIESYTRMLLGRLMAKENISRSDEAQEYIRESIKTLEELKIVPIASVGYLHLGELYTDMGQREKALETLNKAESAFSRMGMDYWLHKTQKVLEKLQG